MNNNPTNIKRIQEVQYSILVEIKRICIKHHINYFLCCGTLLGAIRHRGPIPWDDDLDVGFLRCDYEKFLKIAELELSDSYFLQTWDTDKGYALPHCKIRDRFSHYIEKVSEKSGCCDGISVDVLPFDAVPELLLKRYVHCYVLFDILNLIKLKRGWVFIKESRVSLFRRFLYSLIINHVKEDSLVSTYNRIQQKYNNGDSRLVSETAGLDYLRFVEKRENYEHFIDANYEHERFQIPKNYDEVLKNTYGDYKKMPPIEMRTGQPGVIKVDFI